MWETKLNASRAIQTDSGESNEAASSSDIQQPLRLPISSSAITSLACSSTLTMVDIKPNVQHLIDPATRAALQALPHSIYPSSAVTQDPMPKTKKQMAAQLDGGGIDDTSSDEDEDEDENEIVEADENEDELTPNEDSSENGSAGKEDSDPLNSDDDLTEPGTPNSDQDLFDTEHVIVCQYDKVILI